MKLFFDVFTGVLAGAMGIFLAIGLAVGLFCLGLEIVCWYFKFSERSDLLVEIRDELKKEKK